VVQTAFVCILDVGLREGLLGTGRGAAFALGVVLLLLVSGLAGVGLGSVAGKGGVGQHMERSEGQNASWICISVRKQCAWILQVIEPPRDVLVVLLDLLLLSVGELVLLDGDFRGHGVSGGWCLLRVSA
jgi:hypothetical protein